MAFWMIFPHFVDLSLAVLTMGLLALCAMDLPPI